MKRQKHYLSEKQITKDIEKAQRREKRLRAQACELDANADKLFKTGNDGDCEAARCHREDADKLRAKAGRIATTRLEKLKRALAAFNTQTLPGMGDNCSVVLEKL